MTLSVIFFPGLSYAQPLETIDAAVVDYDNNQATVSVSWNYDQTISNYEIGCVKLYAKCFKVCKSESVTLSGITPLPNTHTALLYTLIAYDSDGEINNAIQIFVDLEN